MPDDLAANDAVMSVIVGDLGLINGEWSIIGAIADWDRALWPMPDFVRRDPLGVRRPVLVRYRDSDPNVVELERLITDAAGLTRDSVYGYGAVEIALTRVLSQEDTPAQDD